jgi:DNA-binding transcriptional ArsR family regulator
MSSDHLTITFAALADPTRRAILARLITGEASVTELAEPFEMSMPAVSKHLKVLERAGLIARSREAQWRPCRLDTGPLKEIADWVEPYRQIWEQRLDRLDEYLHELKNSSATENVARAPRPAKGSGDTAVGGPGTQRVARRTKRMSRG